MYIGGKNKMEEKYIWRVIFIITILMGCVISQLDDISKENIVNDIKDIVGKVDNNRILSHDEQNKISENTLNSIQEDIKIIPYNKCVIECRQLLYNEVIENE